jgi:nitrite reductase/ring-hydroxylating ferredoxin subunit
VRGLSSEREYVLECGCARRSFEIATGKCTVTLQ